MTTTFHIHKGCVISKAGRRWKVQFPGGTTVHCASLAKARTWIDEHPDKQAPDPLGASD